MSDYQKPRRLGRDDPALPAVLALIRTAFAYMEGRIDPPSSMHRLTLEDLNAQTETAEIWVIENEEGPVGCVVLTPREGALYLGKLAVATAHRGRGLARQLVTLAETRARAMGRKAIELQSRVELTENHSAFSAMGFRVAAETAHPGFDRSTSLVFVKPV